MSENDSRDIPGFSNDTLRRGLEGASRRGAIRRESLRQQLDAEAAADRKQVWHDNRTAALRGPVQINGVDHWWCVCVCRWSSLRLPDPEAAKREYDKHPCSINGEDHIDRALKELQQTEREDNQRTKPLVARPKSSLIPALEAQRTSADEQLLGREAADAVLKALEENTAERFDLLELGEKR